MNPPDSSRVKSESSSTKSVKQSTPSPKSSKSTASSGRSSVIMPTLEPSERPAPDLPYMGEITLDSKPRRGRKPKKADICHLIYKNYGTIFPPPKTEEAANPTLTVPPPAKPKLIWAKDPQQLMAPQKNSAMGQQWQTPSSLLERRLTSSEADAKFGHQFVMPGNFPAKNNCDFSLNRTKSSSSSSVRTSSDCDEMHDPSLMRSPQLAQACVERLLSYAAAGFNPQKGSCVQAEPLNLCTRDKKPNDGLLLMSSSSDSEDDDGRPKGPSDGFVFWPNPNVFVNPQLLYKTPPPSAASSQPPPRLLPPPPPQKMLTTAAGKKKRKRSAIFIPPAESPTEVSICKFKFTGGAKPSLEEKKMLSVDAGGNFRFYSGTDKGMRSFLPHLQQHPQTQNPTLLNSSSGPSPSSSSVSPTQGVKNLNISERVHMPSASSAPHHLARLHPPSGPNPLSFMPQGHDDLLTKRKRRSRKSEVREKLEKTFKEKGFLIQTQQLESAEGATYCKFRQLRKFTRYLFRSWRDYLPENVQQLPAGQQQQHQMRMHDYEQSNSGSQETVILPHSP